MSHDFERELRRRFAEAGHPRADEAFVAQVSARMRRQRRQRTATRFGMTAALALGAGVAAPSALHAFDYVARLPEFVAPPIADALATPIGWAFSAIVASVVVLRVVRGA